MLCSMVAISFDGLSSGEKLLRISCTGVTQLFRVVVHLITGLTRGAVIYCVREVAGFLTLEMMSRVKLNCRKSRQTYTTRLSCERHSLMHLKCMGIHDGSVQNV